MARCCEVALLQSARLLLLPEMEGWRRPAGTSQAGVTAFLARPRAWPALPKPRGRQEFHDPKHLLSPQGFMKSGWCRGETCEGQDMVGVIAPEHSSGNREMGGSGWVVRAAGGCVLWALATTMGTSQGWPQPWSNA